MKCMLVVVLELKVASIFAKDEISKANSSLALTEAKSVLGQWI